MANYLQHIMTILISDGFTYEHFEAAYNAIYDLQSEDKNKKKKSITAESIKSAHTKKSRGNLPQGIEAGVFYEEIIEVNYPTIGELRRFAKQLSLALEKDGMLLSDWECSRKNIDGSDENAFDPMDFRIYISDLLATDKKSKGISSKGKAKEPLPDGGANHRATAEVLQELEIEETMCVLSAKMDAIVANMEIIQQKLNRAVSEDDAFWVGVYHRQLEVQLGLQEQLEAMFRKLYQQREQCDEIIRAMRELQACNTYAAELYGMETAHPSPVMEAQDQKAIVQLSSQMKKLSSEIKRTGSELEEFCGAVSQTSRLFEGNSAPNLMGNSVARVSVAGADLFTQEAAGIFEDIERLTAFLETKAAILATAETEIS